MVCTTCGYEWQKEEDKRHNCAPVLKKKYDELKEKYDNIVVGTTYED